MTTWDLRPMPSVLGHLACLLGLHKSRIVWVDQRPYRACVRCAMVLESEMRREDDP